MAATSLRRIFVKSLLCSGQLAHRGPLVSCRALSTTARVSHDFPSDRKYTASHEWVKQDDNGITVGVTDYAQEQLGDLVFVELPGVGDTVDEGGVLASLESVKTVGEISSPCNGTVVEVNTLLEDQANTINKDPYGDGWIAKVKGEVDGDALLTADDYDKQVQGQ